MWICSHWWPDCSWSSQFHVFSLGWWVGLFVFVLLWGLLTLEAIASWSLSSKTRPYINSDSWLATRADYWAPKDGGGCLPGLCRSVAAPGLSVHRAPGLISSYLRLRGDQSQPTASLEFVIPAAYAFFLLLFLKLFKSRLLRVPGQPQLTYYSQLWWWTPDSPALGSQKALVGGLHQVCAAPRLLKLPLSRTWRFLSLQNHLCILKNCWLLLLLFYLFVYFLFWRQGLTLT